MKVIAAIDGSRHSQPAIDALIGMRWPVGAQIKLLAVIAPNEAGVPLPGHGNVRLSPQAMHEAHEATETSLAGLASELQSSLPHCQVSYGVEQGEAQAIIVAMATSWHADLIVMGSRGNRGIDLLLLGSVSQAVLNHSPCPVLIIKSEAAETYNLQGGFRNVVLTVDNSAYTRAAMRWLSGFKWEAGTVFHLVTVIDSVPGDFSFELNTARAGRLLQQHESMDRGAKTELNNLALEVRTLIPGATVNIHVGCGDPKDAILELADTCNADLIVMGSHGRGGIKKLILGSVSQAVSVQAKCAIAIVRGLVRNTNAEMQRTGMFKMPQSTERPARQESSYSTSSSNDQPRQFGGF
jgi:nucleotide-binding universal stress UspA family protein